MVSLILMMYCISSVTHFLLVTTSHGLFLQILLRLLVNRWVSSRYLLSTLFLVAISNTPFGIKSYLLVFKISNDKATIIFVIGGETIPINKMTIIFYAFSSPKSAPRNTEDEIFYSGCRTISITLSCTTPLETKTDLSKTQNLPPSMRVTAPPASSTICTWKQLLKE